MLSGKLDGALDEWKTRANSYAAVNLFKAVRFFLEKKDGFDAYGREMV